MAPAEWWEAHIVKVAEFIARNRPLAIQVINATKGSAHNEHKKDWSKIIEVGRSLAPAHLKSVAYGLNRFCWPVRRRIITLLGYPSGAKTYRVWVCGRCQVVRSSGGLLKVRGTTPVSTFRGTIRASSG